MNKKNVSVILPIYNEKFNYINSSVSSILSQTYKNFELIIVVDNPDLSIRIKKYLINLKKTHSNVKLIFNKYNYGLAKSLNIGIKKSAGYYIARMDADDISLVDRIAIEYKYCTENKCDILYSNISLIDSNGTLIKKNISFDKHPSKVLPFFCCVNHPTVFAKRNALLRIGGYRNIKFCEDYDLWLRALNEKLTINSINIPLLKYRIRNDSISHKNYYMMYCYEKYVKHIYHKRLNNEKYDCDSAEFVKHLYNEKTADKYNYINYIYLLIVNNISDIDIKLLASFLLSFFNSPITFIKFYIYKIFVKLIRISYNML